LGAPAFLVDDACWFADLFVLDCDVSGGVPALNILAVTPDCGKITTEGGSSSQLFDAAAAQVPVAGDESENAGLEAAGSVNRGMGGTTVFRSGLVKLRGSFDSV